MIAFYDLIKLDTNRFVDVYLLALHLHRLLFLPTYKEGPLLESMPNDGLGFRLANWLSKSFNAFLACLFLCLSVCVAIIKCSLWLVLRP